MNARRLFGMSRRVAATRKFCLALELLEDRTVLSAVVPPPGHSNSSTDYDPSTILVRFREETGAPGSGGDILAGTAIGPAIAPRLVPRLHEVVLDGNVTVPAALAAYNASPWVEYAEPNFRGYVNYTPNDPMFSQLYGMERIQAPLAWDLWRGSGNTIIASIDTGVDYNHPDLRDNMWPGIGRSFVPGEGTPLDFHGHGTHTAGTMAAQGDNRLGVVGVNHDAQIMAVKALSRVGQGQIGWWISALDYAVTNGASISNNSYGCFGCYSFSYVTALEGAREAGHIFVAAAGNSNLDNDIWPHYPTNYGTLVDNVISVAATDEEDARAEFSNYGLNSVHLGAPGVNIVSTHAGGGYRFSNGTSMAAPHVAGALALVRDAFVTFGFDFEPWVYRLYVMITGDPVPSLDGITVSGRRLNVARMFGLATAPGGAGRDPVVTDSLMGDPLRPAGRQTTSPQLMETASPQGPPAMVEIGTACQSDTVAGAMPAARPGADYAGDPFALSTSLTL